MKIAFLVYEGLTTLDLIGPYEVFNATPGCEIAFVAKQAGEVRVDSRAFGIVVDHTLTEVDRPDVFVIPGGSAGTFAAAADEEILNWVRKAHEESVLSTSVCTGSLILGAAGLLQGHRATTHWAAVPLLEQHGASYVSQRIVSEGKIITAAGVSAGIDMALFAVSRLFDEETARAAQLAIEYDPEPPFDSGSPDKAGKQIVERALTALTSTRD